MKKEKRAHENDEQREDDKVNQESTSTHADPDGAGWRCPFFNPIAALCQAAHTPRMPPREIRAFSCASEAYEDCTTFLVGLLIRPPARTR